MVYAMITPLITGLALSLLLVSTPVSADVLWQNRPLFQPTLRCAGRIISVGDSAASLVYRCGEPSSIERTAAYTTDEPVWETRNGHRIQTGTTSVSHPGYETWRYHYGRGRFNWRIVIDDAGRIGAMSQDSYGD